MKENESTAEIKIEEESPKKKRKKFFERRSGWIITGVILVFVIFAMATVSGAARGINDRVSLAETQAAPKIQSQLNSARLDIEEGRYDVALGRLDWILNEMSSFMNEDDLAEVAELYSHTLLLMSSTKTPTPIPTSTPTPTEPAHTPTPDLRDEEELFNTARQLLVDGAWDEVIQTLEVLRENDITYRAVQVDGMLYIALRNRGLQKILVDGSLEPGIYDLSLSERFAPLDSTAQGIRIWARLYLTGASYWDVDWSQVVYYFEQIYPHLPNLRDGTFMTARERFRIGSIEYATQLTELGDYCNAQVYFEKALSIGDDPAIQETADQVAEECFKLLNPPTEVPLEEPTPTLTPGNGSTAPTQAAPTQAPTQAPTETEAPTEEPTVGPTEEPTEVPGNGGG